MKKIVLLFMCLMLVLVSPAIFAGDFEFVGGLTFNTFDVRHEFEDGYVEGTEDYLYGNGLYLGGRYWFNDKLAAGLGYDYVQSEPNYYWEYEYENQVSEYVTNEYGEKLDLKGLYGELVYRLTDYINIKGALVSYDLTGKYYSDSSCVGCTEYDESEEYKGSGMGYLFGAEMNFPLTEALDLNSTLAYRTTSIDMEEYFYISPDSTDTEQTIDLEGVCFSVGLNYAF